MFADISHMETQPMWWGYNNNFQMSGRARNFIMLMIGLFIMLMIFRSSGWWIFVFFIFPMFFRFGRDWFDSDQSAAEKRKREPETILIMPEDKPKRDESASRYALGDDGELIELDDRKGDQADGERSDPDRRDQDDEPPRRAYNRDEYV
ncbi:MAG: hypothetical protein CUN53_09945 [Phototrophicales bacterium]|nr:MAG: hypothetical protein CUN53_09945 [Phototrophicales bacterium]